jgi:glycosyltransferase involved in cell wall biosynthesis
MGNKPLISIVIANYNSENYINDTLHSLYIQTYDNIEIIVVDVSVSAPFFELG